MFIKCVAFLFQYNGTGSEAWFAFPSSLVLVESFTSLNLRFLFNKIKIIILTLENWHLENYRSSLRFSREFLYKERIFIEPFFGHMIPVSSGVYGLLVGIHVYFPLDVASRDTGSIFI